MTSSSLDATPSVSADTGAMSAAAPETPPVITSEPNSTQTVTQTPDASAPPSSAPQGSETKEDLLSAVMKVVKTDPDADKIVLPGDGTPPGSEQSQSEQAETDANSTEELPEEVSKEELDRYPVRTRKRIRRLLAERDTARSEAQALKVEAQTAVGLRTFLHQHDIQKEDFAVLLDLGVALRKGDFTTFYQGVKPYVDLAEEALGLRVPDDLAQRVQMGHMTTEQARIFAQERMARQLAESQAQRAAQLANQQVQQYQQAQTQSQQQALAQSVKQAVSTWEATMRQSDPDYGHKQDAVRNFLWAVVQERGAPQTPEHAVEIAREAYRRANDMVGRFAPKPKPTAPVPSSVNRNAGASPEPKSLMEAAKLGLQRSYRNG